MKKQQKNVKSSVKSVPVSFEGRFANTVFCLLVLASVTFVVYSRTLFLDYTRLDDSIFIVENAHYNADLHNIGVSFHRGLFNPTKDAYYRPLFLVDFIIESRFFGISPAGYHFTNLLFHIISVMLLFLFFRKIKIPPLNAFLLSLIFAVHPVLTQAVAWIPGRNDMLLMIFFLSLFIVFLRYLEKPSALTLIFQSLLLLAALFTKETAIIIPVILGGVALFYLKCGWRKLVIPVISWVAALFAWVLVRTTAPLSKDWISPAQMFHTALERMGVVVQYIGKIFFPVNLTVFPVAEDITLVWGFAALAAFIALIIYSKSYTRPLTWIGLGWFIVFLVPVLIVPKSLNDQVFEHRLYLPIIGILMMLSQAFPFTGNIKPRVKFICVTAIALVFATQSFVRTGYFSDALTFWTHAVTGSPHSAYARMLLGTKVDSAADRERLFKEAHALDPALKNLNYYLGKVLLDRKQPDSAELYLRQELVHYPLADAYFLLAQIEFGRNRMDSAAVNLEKVVEMEPLHSQACHNLALLYFQQGRADKSKQLIEGMQLRGMEVDDLLRMVNKK